MSKLGDFFGKLPDQGIIKVMGGYGSALIAVANNSLGINSVEVGHKAAAKAIVSLAKLAGADEGRDAVDIIKEFVELGLADITEFESVSDNEIKFSFDRCPYGLCDGEHAQLCHAVMNLEETVAAQLGGEFITEARIPEGAQRCRFTVRNL